MLRPPPTSTLFPTRRSSDLAQAIEAHLVFDQLRRITGRTSEARADLEPLYKAHPNDRAVRTALGEVRYLRSEEHTSELQSQFHLVCRLLLEKKYFLAIPKLR